MRSAILLFFLACVAPMAAAELQERDFLTSGDGLITYDTATGLEWLDLPQTVGLSYNQILASPLVTEHKFRFATEDDLRTLYAAAGIPSFVGQSSTSPNNAAGTELLLSLVGCTDQCLAGWPAGQGWLDVGSDTSTYYAFYQWGFDGTSHFGGITLAWGWSSRDLVSTITGGFLVRPSSLTIEQMLDALYDDLAGIGPGNSLGSKVSAVMEMYSSGDVAAACQLLKAFSKQVVVQSCNSVSPELAQFLVEESYEIGQTMGCE